MALIDLNISRTAVRDLAPLKGMMLKSLDCSYSPVKSLDPLKGMPFNYLNAVKTDIDSIEALRGMTRLRLLNISATSVSDLSPLSGMKGLAFLALSDTQVKDISPIEHLPLKYVALPALGSMNRESAVIALRLRNEAIKVVHTASKNVDEGLKKAVEAETDKEKYRKEEQPPE
ncbi:MAG: hypothetical protein O3B01_12845 [Planctomycetota bacterium]|nr:hypothetical protein [Planctomycetota bacterium]